MTFEPPNAVGAELVMFREDGDRHTLVTICGALFFQDLPGVRSVTLVLALHDASGAFVASWNETLGAEDVVFIDSRAVPVRPLPAEGVLVVWVVPEHAPAGDHFSRTNASVDWFSDRGELASLHTDQSILPPGRSSEGIELTEIVFCETSDVSTSLVIVNGREEQPPASLELVLRNHRGEERRVVYAPAMRPFSLHRLELGTLTSDLPAFCEGREATVAGSFGARGIYTRPWVETAGRIVSAYHGGDRYRAMGSIPKIFAHAIGHREAPRLPLEILRIAKEEMNPAYAVHRPEAGALTTRIHLFQSHGSLEDDYGIDVRLYDRSGRLVRHEENAFLAPRLGATSFDVRDLVGGEPFEGHIALRYAQDEAKTAFPQRVQALLEYRTGTSLARTMLWSDRWNAPDRLQQRSRLYRALYRVFLRGPRTSTLAITNPSVAPDYSEAASFTVRLQSARGEERVFEGTIPPNGTFVASVEELFEGFEDELAIAIVESAFDLASMHLTCDERSGVVAAEHLLAIIDREGDAVFAPCGS